MCVCVCVCVCACACACACVFVHVRVCECASCGTLWIAILSPSYILCFCLPVSLHLHPITCSLIKALLYIHVYTCFCLPVLSLVSASLQDSIYILHGMVLHPTTCSLITHLQGNLFLSVELCLNSINLQIHMHTCSIMYVCLCLVLTN